MSHQDLLNQADAVLIFRDQGEDEHSRKLDELESTLNHLEDSVDQGFSTLQRADSKLYDLSCRLERMAEQADDRAELARKYIQQQEQSIQDLIGEIDKAIGGELIRMRDAILQFIANNSQCTGEIQSFLSHLDKQIVHAMKQRHFHEMDHDQKSFDPEFHEAVDTASTSDANSHETIAEVKRPGYLYRDTVFRKAEVSVFKRSNFLHRRR